MTINFNLMLKSPGEIIKDSWALYAKNWRKFVPLLLVMLLPSAVLSILGASSLYLQVYVPKSSVLSNLLLLAVFVASLVLALWGSIALIRAIAAANDNQPFGWKTIFSTSGVLIWPVLWTSFLVSIIVLGGTLLLIVPGIIFAIWYNFSLYAIIFENARGLNALRASKALVAGRWWAIFWRWVAQGLVFTFVNLVLTYLLTAVVLVLPLPLVLETTLIRIMSSLAGLIVSPLVVGAALILYQSAKQNPVAQPASSVPSA